MSKSYKHVSCCKGYNRRMKKYANRYMWRNHLVVPSGMAYKSCFALGIFMITNFLKSFTTYKKKFSKI